MRMFSLYVLVTTLTKCFESPANDPIIYIALVNQLCVTLATETNNTKLSRYWLVSKVMEPSRANLRRFCGWAWKGCWIQMALWRMSAYEKVSRNRLTSKSRFLAENSSRYFRIPVDGEWWNNFWCLAVTVLFSRDMERDCYHESYPTWRG